MAKTGLGRAVYSSPKQVTAYICLPLDKAKSPSRLLFLGCAILHLGLNTSWFLNLARGRWNRSLRAAAVLALLLALPGMFISSAVMAGEVFSFPPFPMVWWGRGLHTSAAVWLYVLAAFHLGLHGAGFWQHARQTTGRTWPLVLGACLLLTGWTFTRSGLGSQLLFADTWNSEIPAPGIFYSQYIGAALFFCLLGRAATTIPRWLPAKGK